MKQPNKKSLKPEHPELLDLTYVCPRIIAMTFPNNIKEVIFMVQLGCRIFEKETQKRFLGVQFEWNAIRQRPIFWEGLLIRKTINYTLAMGGEVNTEFGLFVHAMQAH